MRKSPGCSKTSRNWQLGFTLALVQDITMLSFLLFQIVRYVYFVLLNVGSVCYDFLFILYRVTVKTVSCVIEQTLNFQLLNNVVFDTKWRIEVGLNAFCILPGSGTGLEQSND